LLLPVTKRLSSTSSISLSSITENFSEVRDEIKLKEEVTSTESDRNFIEEITPDSDEENVEETPRESDGIPSDITPKVNLEEANIATTTQVSI